MIGFTRGTEAANFSDFLRLQDLYPLVQAFATPEARAGVLPG